MLAEISGDRLLIYPETPTEKAAMVAFCDMYRDKDKKPTILTLDSLVRDLGERRSDSSS